MSSHILKCRACNAYTLESICPKCNKKTSEVKPPKYSPEDKYAKYRREYKKQNQESPEEN
jgi:H/ACA ribonucleoprotein complex subunit 3